MPSLSLQYHLLSRYFSHYYHLFRHPLRQVITFSFGTIIMLDVVMLPSGLLRTFLSPADRVSSENLLS